MGGDILSMNAICVSSNIEQVSKSVLWSQDSSDGYIVCSFVESAARTDSSEYWYDISSLCIACMGTWGKVECQLLCVKFNNTSVDWLECVQYTQVQTLQKIFGLNTWKLCAIHIYQHLHVKNINNRKKLKLNMDKKLVRETVGSAEA